MTTYYKNLSEPWFSLIKLKLKQCEGRINKGDFANMNKDDYIVFANDSFGFIRSFRIQITSIKKYSTFEEYLNSETLRKCLPGIENISDGVKIYRKYYSEEDENTFGIIAIRFKLVN